MIINGVTALCGYEAEVLFQWFLSYLSACYFACGKE
jgi:hypothetical protein